MNWLEKPTARFRAKSSHSSLFKPNMMGFDRQHSIKRLTPAGPLLHQNGLQLTRGYYTSFLSK